MATEQDIANILGEIGQNINRLVKALVENALFTQTGKLPEEKRKGAGADHLERGPRPPSPKD
jgi:hypothetical protein